MINRSKMVPRGIDTVALAILVVAAWQVSQRIAIACISGLVVCFAVVGTRKLGAILHHQDKVTGAEESRPIGRGGHKATALPVEHTDSEGRLVRQAQQE